MRQSFMALMVLGGTLVAAGPVATEPAVPSGPGTIILDTGSFWRCRFAASAPVVRINGELQEIDDAGSAGPLKSKVAAPPAGWAEPDFDDSAWARVPGPFFPSQRGHAYSPESEGMGFIRFEETSPRLALICLRGGFQVTDPGAAQGLRLSMSFRGGAVVYLNGREIARAHLPALSPSNGPKDQLDASALAEDYPKEAFVTAAGGPIWYAFNPEVRDRLALRIRSLGDVAIPANLLRKGRNILAVEIHRAPYHETVMLGKEKKKFYGNEIYNTAWTTAGVTQMALRAYGAGAVPNNARPGGFQLWNADPLVPVFETDYGEAGEGPRPIRLVGTPNGRFAGQVVAGCHVPIKGLRARMSDLALEGGTGRIAASAVSIGYPLPASGEQWYQDIRPRVPGAKGVACFDALMESPPAEVPVRTKPMQGVPPAVFGAVQPIWITVSVPAGAAAGEYRGNLTVGADGQQSVDVPVHLKVCAWELPDPRNFRAFVDFIQSPETVALQYDAPLWSEKHLAMLDQSLKWLGSVGNKTVYIPLICRTNFGNEQSMVRWIKQSDGTYKHDFGPVDQYLDLVEKHLGKPPVVCLYVWDLYAGGGLYGAGVKEWKPVLVSELDAASGKVQEMAGPMYNEAEKARAFWKPVAESLRERLKKRGLEKSLMIGIVCDIIPDQEVVAFWKEILPEAKWVSMAHALKWEVRGVPVGYASTVWQAFFAPDPSVERLYGWDKPWDKRKGLAHGFVTQFARVGPLTLTPQMQLIDYAYLAGERNITGMQNGAGRMPADFWPVLKSAHSSWGSASRGLAARYPEESNWKQLNFDGAYLHPGPAGAVSTLRFEVIRQGLQECEARIFIESALLDKAQRANLGAEMAERCQALLDERTRALRGAGEGTAGDYGFVASGWQERAGKIYELAGEAARKLGFK
ncbi:MAG: glycoside hydrolase domain-containing protein [Planctomycetota bacterium]